MSAGSSRTPEDARRLDDSTRTSTLGAKSSRRRRVLRRSTVGRTTHSADLRAPNADSRGYGRDFLALLVAPAFRELDAIIVAPDCPETHWTLPASERALLALIEHIRRARAVDSERIVVTGFSVGAMGAWFMASRHPDLFSAAVPIAGSPVLRPVAEAFAGLEEAERFLGSEPVEWPATLRQTPILAIHSRADELVPFALIDRAASSLRVAGGRIELIDLEGIGHFETPRYIEHLARAVEWLQGVWRGAG